IEIHADSESPVSLFSRRREFVFGTHVSRCQELRCRIRPISSGSKPVITNLGSSWLHLVIFRQVIKIHLDPNDVAVLRSWPWLYSNLESKVTLRIRIGSL